MLPALVNRARQPLAKTREEKVPKIAIRGLVAVVLASLSYRLMERPILGLRFSHQSTALRSVVAAAGPCLFICGLIYLAVGVPSR